MESLLMFYFVILLGKSSISVGGSSNSPIIFKLVDFYEKIWDDRGSKAIADVSFWRPKSPSHEYFALGDVVIARHSKPEVSAVIVKAVEPEALKAPTGFLEIWNDRGSKANRDVRILKMVPSAGYTCLGHVAVGGHSMLPDINKYRCVRTPYVTPGRLSHVWDDRGSNVLKDFGAWAVIRGSDVHGLETGCFISSATHSQPSEVGYLLNTKFAKEELSTDVDYSNARIKLYQREELDLVWKDAGSRGKYDFSCWRVRDVAARAYRLTDIPADNYDKPGFAFLAEAFRNPDDLRPPYDYRKTWGDHGSSATLDGALWEPLCPGGYLALGYLCTRGYTKPSSNEMRCVNETLVSHGSWHWVWNDQGTSAKSDCTVYRAVPNDIGQQEVFGMGAIARHGEMASPAYVLKGDKTVVTEGLPNPKVTSGEHRTKVDKHVGPTSAPAILRRSIARRRLGR